MGHGIRYIQRVFFSLFFIIPIGFISHTTPRKTRQKKLLSNFVAIKINMAYGNGPESAYKVANRISNNPARIVSLAVSFYLSLSLFFFFFLALASLRL